MLNCVAVGIKLGVAVVTLVAVMLMAVILMGCDGVKCEIRVEPGVTMN